MSTFGHASTLRPLKNPILFSLELLETPPATVSNLGESPPEVQILTDPVSVRVATTSDPTSASVSVVVYDDFVDAAENGSCRAIRCDCS